MALDGLLGALSAERVLVACKVEPKPSGGTNKIPVDPSTGLAISAHDAALRMYPYEWLALPPHPYLLGVVLTDEGKRFCIDLDHAYDPATGKWSDYALTVLAAFPNAYREMSHSGTGLHIHGKYRGELPPHRTRRAGLPGLEVYTRLRFILQTGTGASGDYDADCTEALVQLIASSFEAVAEAPSREWTTEAAPGYSLARMDDRALVEHIANRQGSAASIWGTQPSFTDVWTGSAKAREYFHDDDSALDMALASRLAYYTGKNCERTLQVMQLAPIARDKWQREDYLRRTVLQAVSTTPNYPGSDVAPLPPVPMPSVEQPQPVSTAPVEQPKPVIITAEDLAKANPVCWVAEQQVMFAGCFYVQDIHCISMPDGTLLDEKRFNVRFGGREFMVKSDGTKGSKNAWDAYCHNEMHRFPRVDGLTFAPTLAPRALISRDGRSLLNTWVPVDVPMVEGDVTPYLTQLAKMIPDARDQQIYLSFAAFCVQHKGRKASWAIFMQGVEGNGKTFLSRMLQHCISDRYTYASDAKQLDNRFNDAYCDKLLVTIEDVYISESRSSVWESLKPMITEPRLDIEAKGLPRVNRDVCFNIVMNSNHKDGVRKTRNDRRLCVFYCAQQTNLDLKRDGMDGDYFPRLNRWADHEGGRAAIHHYLAHYTIPDEFNPLVGAYRAPMTTSVAEALRASRSMAEQAVADAIEAQQDGFRDGWVNDGKLVDLLATVGQHRFNGPNKRAQLMSDFGYIPHPGLKDGRPVAPMADGRRPILYVTSDHTSLLMGTDSASIVGSYNAAQSPFKT